MEMPTYLAKVTAALVAGAHFAPPVHADDAADSFFISAIAAWAGQCQSLSENSGVSDACRGALVFRPNLRFLLTPDNEFSVELGFAAGYGLNDVSPFNLSPWAADLEDDVKDINGRGRNYLLTAWYRHGFFLAQDNRLNITVGIIDSTSFLDNNAYANDEYTQFMNEAFVNSPQISTPSYDWGGAIQWDIGRWSLRGVLMQVGKKQDSESENGGQASVRDLEKIKIRDLRRIFGCSFRCNIGRIAGYVTGVATEDTAKKTSQGAYFNIFQSPYLSWLMKRSHWRYFRGISCWRRSYCM